MRVVRSVGSMGPLGGVRAVFACALLTVAAVFTVTGCQQSAEGSAGSSTSDSAGASGAADGTTVDQRPAPPRPSGYGAVFLAVDECSSFGTTSFTEVPCTSERAAARVVARYDGEVSRRSAVPGDHRLRAAHQRDSGPPPTRTATEPSRRATPVCATWRPRTPATRAAAAARARSSATASTAPGDGQVRETACDGKGREATGVQGGGGGRPTRQVPDVHGPLRPAGRRQTGGLRPARVLTSASRAPGRSR